MQWLLILAVSVVLAEADDCDTTPPADKLTPHWKCCKVSNNIPDDFSKNLKKCLEKYPAKASAIFSSSKEMIANATCLSECMFQEGGLLTAKKTLDKDAIIKVFAEIFGNDKEWASVYPKTLEKCFASYTSQVDKSMQCKSGAKEFEMCVLRESFLTCPKSLWADSADCKNLKDLVTKCPKVPVMLLPPKED